MSPRRRYTLPPFIASPAVLLSLPPELKATYDALLGYAFVNDYQWTDVPARPLCQHLGISEQGLRNRLERLQSDGWLKQERRPGHPNRIILNCRYDPLRKTVLVPSAVTPGDVDAGAPDAETGVGNADDPPSPLAPPSGVGDRGAQDLVVGDLNNLSGYEKQQQKSFLKRRTPPVDLGGRGTDEDRAVLFLLDVGVTPRSVCEELVREHGVVRCVKWARWGRGRGQNSGGLVRARIESGEPPPEETPGELRERVLGGQASPDETAAYYRSGPRGHLVLH